jgi:branched-subunit amino acid aminotransferase/4-amino-4-deoxychorismate lyase
LRIPEGDPLSRHKLLSAARQRAARRIAAAAGAGEAILLDDRGHLVEASHAALLVVSGGRLLTPPLRCGALDSLTAGLLFAIAPLLGLRGSRSAIGREDLASSDAVLVASTVRGVVALASLDGIALPDGSGWARDFEEQRVRSCRA